MLPVKYQFCWPSRFREEDFSLSANQKQESPMAAMFVDRSGRNQQIYKGPHIDASYHILVHLAKQFQRRFFYFSQSETRIAHSGHVC